MAARSLASAFPLSCHCFESTPLFLPPQSACHQSQCLLIRRLRTIDRLQLKHPQLNVRREVQQIRDRGHARFGQPKPRLESKQEAPKCACFATSEPNSHSLSALRERTFCKSIGLDGDLEH